MPFRERNPLRELRSADGPSQRDRPVRPAQRRFTQRYVVRTADGTVRTLFRPGCATMLRHFVATLYPRPPDRWDTSAPWRQGVRLPALPHNGGGRPPGNKVVGARTTSPPA